ncbi:MAG: GreA/GreB family elongation factor [Bacteroidota bacterium]|nr:GreA/GreB family elongation factor [Bacteroidota bacterium]
MTNSEKIEYKITLQKRCIAILEDRIYSIRSAMKEAQLAANSEEKSSAGDKYETARAMSHLEKNMQASRLSASLKELENLLQGDCNKIFEVVQKGSFVQCDKVSYFIAAGLGKLLIENKTVFLISPNSPVALKLSGKKAGDAFEFNNQKFTIKKVY